MTLENPLSSKHKTPNGFTLIELSIVLVIIGLIIGGVLVGQELVSSSKNRAGIAQIQQYTAAVATFKTKYDCIPGACANAEQLGLGTSGNPGANGYGGNRIYDGGINGLAGTNWMNGTAAGNFWYHLMKANLITDQVTGYTYPFTKVSDYAPKLKFSENSYLWVASGTYGVGTKALGNMFVVVQDTTISPWAGYALTAATAYYIDTKIDDGLPLTGMTRDRYGWANPLNVSDQSTVPGCAGAYGCDLNGCGDNNIYDVQGLINVNTQLGESPPNPGRLECSVAIGNIW